MHTEALFTIIHYLETINHMLEWGCKVLVASLMFERLLILSGLTILNTNCSEFGISETM